MELILQLDEIPDDLLEFFEPNTKDKADVWRVTTKPFKQSHFATFPPDLVEPCILASTSQRGVCSKCGAPWVRVVEKTGERETHGINKVADLARGRHGKSSIYNTAVVPIKETTGWRASCACDAGEPVPATVLDPFGGSGTTALVAAQHGRDAILIDLKREYLEMARERISAGLGAFADIHASYDVSVTA